MIILLASSSDILKAAVSLFNMLLSQLLYSILIDNLVHIYLCILKQPMYSYYNY